MAPWLLRLAWLPIPVFLVAIGVLAILHVEAVWNPPLLIPALNIVFGINVVFILVLAMKSYLAGLSRTVLLLGCAMFAVVLGSLTGQLFILGNYMSSNMAIVSMMMCVSAFCIMASAMSSISPRPRRLSSGWQLLLTACLAILAIYSLLVVLIQYQLWPVHYVEGSGATIFGKVFFWAAVALIALAAILLIIRQAGDEANFRRWYSLGLGLVAVGFFGVSLQMDTGDALNWVGRTSEYLGSMYLLVAVVSSIRQSGEWMLPLDKALRETEARYKSLVEMSPDAILLYSDGKCVFANPAAISLLGAGSPDEVVGRDVIKIVHPDHIPPLTKQFREQFREVLNGAPLPLQEARFVRLDDRPVNVEVVGTKAEYGGRPAIQLVVRDITGRKRAEEEYRQNKELLQSIIDYTPAPIYVKDLEGRIIVANQPLGDATGMKVEDIIGKTSRDIMDPRDGEAHMANDRRVIETGQAITFEEFASGYVFLSVKFPIRDARGRIIAVGGVSTDITERKQAEEELKEARMRAELYLDLMGHDINNMHQIALGYLELARGMQADGDEKEFLDTPIEVLQRSARLINNVRKLQKLKEGVFQTHEVDVGATLSDLQREFGAVPNKRVTLKLNGYDHCRVRANELLHDVFDNLVGNAIKHTGDHAHIVIDLDVVEENGSHLCRVSVSDDGPGIPDDFKANIFCRMLNGTDKTKGMGLGLYLVKSLVDSYSGQVWVEDRLPGDHTKGARFVVTLPAV